MKPLTPPNRKEQDRDVNTSSRTRPTRGALTRRSLAAIAALSIVAAACGSSSSTVAAPAPTAAAPSATDAPNSPPAPKATDAPKSTDAAGASTAFGPACSAVPADGAGSFAGMAQDPAATAASNNPVLSTLVAAVTAAGLVDTLNGPGPFTIFAPTNDAFAKIPEADLKAVLADKELLTSILTLHVISGEKLSSADLIKMGKAATVNGADLTFTDNGGLMVNGAKSVCMDIPTANATVHIIDSVLMPA